MESYKIEKLSFSYPEDNKYTLKDINLKINQGEFVCVCGRSGSGKTTLLRLLKPSIAPNGEQSGVIYFEGNDVCDLSQRAQTEKIGFVWQEPDNQIVTDKVWHELAFGLESLGFSTSEIRRRVSEMASFFGIGEWFHKKTDELSGGQKQILNLASSLVTQPDVIILDEPTSQLDPIAASDFCKMLEKINRELGTTVIISEHRLEEILPVSDRVIVMDEGNIIADGDARSVGTILKNKKHDMYLSLPTPMRVYSAVEGDGLCPVTIRDGRLWLEKYSKENMLNPELIEKDEQNQTDDVLLEIKEAWFKYEKNSPDIIKGLSMKIANGEIFSVLGGNGSGKTTMFSLVSGLNKPYRGNILIKGKKLKDMKNLYGNVLGVLPQNPESLFTENNVFSELLKMCEGTKEEKEENINKVVKLCGIEHLMDSHPYDLSGGEKQKTALCMLLLKNPDILLLDEPTKGLDSYFKRFFANVLKELKTHGKTILMVTHDVEFAAMVSDRCAMLFDGILTSTDTPREFFAGNSFYTTSANRMARTVLDKAIFAEDIIRACGKKADVEIKYPPEKKELSDNKKSIKQEKKEIKKEIKASGKKGTVLSVLMLLFFIPLTICLGNKFFGDRKYYFISLLIVIETFIPFFASFERKKPKTREIVIISVICALAVAGRSAFFAFQQFKPVLALVIITGVCFGGETGFLVGAMTGFVSNFFFGHGPWTPWQMVAFGAVGFVSGVVFKHKLIPQKKLPLSIFGLISAVIIYGGIVNIAHVLMSQHTITKEAIFVAYASGLPFDMIHGVSTVFFLWLISEPMIEKIKRVQLKIK